MAPLTPVVHPATAKPFVIRAVRDLDPGEGPHLKASVFNVANVIRKLLQCNTARAMQVCMRLKKDDPAFQGCTDDTIGVCLLDKDCACAPDLRTRAALIKLVTKKMARKATGQFFIPSRARPRFMLDVNERLKTPGVFDWYLSYDGAPQPLRSYVSVMSAEDI
jgi:hypothetical protein